MPLTDEQMFELIPEEQAYAILYRAKVPGLEEAESDSAYWRVIRETSEYMLDTLIELARQEQAIDAQVWLTKRREG